MSVTNVSTITDLNAAIVAADAVTTPGTVTIDITGSIALGATALEAINMQSGVTLDLVGNGNTLDGGGTQRGLFVYAGAVDISGLTLADMKAQGGTGVSGGGGGAGLGGGLFVGANVAGDTGDVTLSGVTFASDAAVGGSTTASNFGMGGGGGLGGNGGDSGANIETGGGGGGGAVALAATAATAATPLPTLLLTVVLGPEARLAWCREPGRPAQAGSA